MATEPDFVSWWSNSTEVQGIVASNGHKSKKNEQFEELLVFTLRHGEQVLYLSVWPDIVDRPVGMLSASVEVEERLLMQQDRKAMTVEGFLQDLHGD